MFFESSSPLRTEADNSFLKELRGQYDVILKHIARQGACKHKDLVDHVRLVNPDSSEQVGGYLRVLIEKYQIIEKKLPIFAKHDARKARYYVTDNFLKAWLAAIACPVSALNFRPIDRLVEDADSRLRNVEGGAFEKLVGVLYQERSRKGLDDFSLTRKIQGYWDRAGIETDLIAMNEQNDRHPVIRFGSCERSAEKLLSDVTIFDGHVQKFLDQFLEFNVYQVERCSFAPELPGSIRRELANRGRMVQDLNDLIEGL